MAEEKDNVSEMIQEVATEKKKKQESFSVALRNELELRGSGLPKELNKERFVANALTLLNEHPEYRNYNVNDLKMGLMKGAILGLDFLSRECYLIPYGNKLNFQTDYKGDVKIARRYAKRPVRDIYAQLVREGDKFEKKIVDNETVVNYTENPFGDGTPIGVFAIVRYEDGGVECETMSKAEIEEVREAFSKSKNSPAWKNTWGEMAKKTCLRRLCKHITIDFESADRQLAYEEGSDMDFKPIKAQPVKIMQPDMFGKKEEIIDSEVKEVKEEK